MSKLWMFVAGMSSTGLLQQITGKIEGDASAIALSLGGITCSLALSYCYDKGGY